MKRVVKLIGVLVALVTTTSMNLMPVVSASASSNVLITEIQTASAVSASEEFIQISNITASSVDITGWRLEYFAANPKSFTTASRTINLSGSIAAYSDLVVASTNYRTDIAKIFYSPTLAAAGGHVRLSSGVVSSPTEIDLVAWGSATNPRGVAATAPQSGAVLRRIKDVQGLYQNTLVNSNDFTVEGDYLNIGSSSSNVIEQIDITELLPNPASPASDATGEFIELHNPNSQPVNLSGYKILSGDNLNHSYIFKDQIINPGTYKAFYVSETKTTLSNASGKAQLQDPFGNVLSESSIYTSAPDGSSWSFIENEWSWTTTPTPGSENVKNDEDSSSATPKTQAKKSSTTKAKSTSASKPKATAPNSSSGSVLSEKTDQPAKSLHTGVLAGVGGLALVYGAYEYRQDIANAYLRIKKFRRNRKAR